MHEAGTGPETDRARHKKTLASSNPGHRESLGMSGPWIAKGRSCLLRATPILGRVLRQHPRIRPFKLGRTKAA